MRHCAQVSGPVEKFAGLTPQRIRVNFTTIVEGREQKDYQNGKKVVPARFELATLGYPAF